jgi:hypothetical protein
MSCVVGDLNNDGVPEFVISTRNPEQLHWFGRTGSGDWEPHSLQVADFDGDGRPDIYVGEMGLTDWPHAQQRIFLSRGDRMEEHIIDAGVGTHEAQVIELGGRVGIVSKPYRSLQDSAPRPAGVDALYLYLPVCGFP